MARRIRRRIHDNAWSGAQLLAPIALKEMEARCLAWKTQGRLVFQSVENAEIHVHGIRPRVV